MSLAILTPTGKAAAADQIEAARIVFGKSKFKFWHTSVKGSAFVDGVITEDGEIVGVAEIKTRDMTLDQLRSVFKNEWLITTNKVGFLKSAAIILGVPGYGILYCKPDNVALMVRICDAGGALTCEIRNEVTTTQATCNGGTAERMNSFIGMHLAKRYP